MEDKWLTEYDRPWKGEGSPRPPQELYDESVKLARQEKAVSQGTVANVYVFVDEAGNMTQQSDRHHFFIPAAYVAAYRALIDSLVPMPDPVVLDINTQNVVPGSNGQMSSNTPMTNKQLSMRQNELTTKYLKSRR